MGYGQAWNITLALLLNNNNISNQLMVNNKAMANKVTVMVNKAMVDQAINFK